jgi:hypothetical protein
MATRNFLLMLVVACAMIGGLFYPAEYRQLAMFLVRPVMPEIFPKTLPWLYFFAQILISTAILFVSGIPAALYERLWEGERITATPMYIWLVGAVILAVPGLRQVGVTQ